MCKNKWSFSNTRVPIVWWSTIEVSLKRKATRKPTRNAEKIDGDVTATPNDKAKQNLSFLSCFWGELNFKSMCEFTRIIRSYVYRCDKKWYSIAFKFKSFFFAHIIVDLSTIFNCYVMRLGRYQKYAFDHNFESFLKIY